LKSRRPFAASKWTKGIDLFTWFPDRAIRLTDLTSSSSPFYIVLKRVSIEVSSLYGFKWKTLVFCWQLGFLDLIRIHITSSTYLHSNYLSTPFIHPSYHLSTYLKPPNPPIPLIPENHLV
jgi:hypothetical protein